MRDIDLLQIGAALSVPASTVAFHVAEQLEEAGELILADLMRQAGFELVCDELTQGYADTPMLQ